MPAIRILLAGPRLFVDLIERLLGTEADISIVGTAPVDGRVMRSARHLDADAIVLVTTADAPAESFDAALYEFPTVTLVALAPDARDATLSQLRPHHTPLGELSRDGLLEAIRAAISATAAGPTPP